MSSTATIILAALIRVQFANGVSFYQRANEENVVRTTTSDSDSDIDTLLSLSVFNQLIGDQEDAEVYDPRNIWDCYNETKRERMKLSRFAGESSVRSFFCVPPSSQFSIKFGLGHSRIAGLCPALREYSF